MLRRSEGRKVDEASFPGNLPSGSIKRSLDSALERKPEPAFSQLSPVLCSAGFVFSQRCGGIQGGPEVGGKAEKGVERPPGESLREAGMSRQQKRPSNWERARQQSSHLPKEEEFFTAVFQEETG